VRAEIGYNNTIERFCILVLNVKPPSDRIAKPVIDDPHPNPNRIPDPDGIIPGSAAASRVDPDTACPEDGGSTVHQDASQVHILLSRASMSAGLLVPGYELIEEIGRGAMGVVYRARHLRLKREVALKMILAGVHASGDTKARFEREAETVAKLQHPNIIQIFEVGDCNGLPYCAIELCTGGTLAEAIAGVVQEPRSAARQIECLAAAMQTVHSAGIVHRDLKPGNVLLRHDGKLRITDFGLAKWMDATSSDSIGGQILGSPNYMAPEQASGDSASVGPAADIWALGAILYELLVGHPPFKGENVRDTLEKVIERQPIPVRRLRSGCPRDLETICLKCLEKDPKRRYRTAAELATDLGHFLADEPITARPPGPVETAGRWIHRHLWQTLAAASLLAFATIAVAVLTIPARDVRPTPPPVVEDSPMLRHRRGEVAQRADFLMRVPPQPDFVPPHPVTFVDVVPAMNQTAFRVLDDDRVIDLRGWKRLAPGEDPKECFVLNTSRQRLAKVEAIDVQISEARTTGSGLVIRSMSATAASARLVSPKAPVVVGRQSMKVLQIHSDVRDIPLFGEFDRHDRMTYLGSLQNADEQWFGVIGTGESVKVAMLMLFPESNPFLTYDLQVAVDRKADSVAYSGPRITFVSPDHRWLYWEISEPKPGHVYRVEWTW